MNAIWHRIRRRRYAIPLMVVGVLLLLIQSAVLVKDMTVRKNGTLWPDLEQKVLLASMERSEWLSEADVSDLLVYSIIQIESGGDPRLVGGAGERGVMQIMSGTWADMTKRRYGKAIAFDRAFEPDLNEEIGRTYLDYLLKNQHQHRTRWKSDERALLLAGYNAGPRAVQRAGFDVRRLPASVQDYVERATALHDMMLAEQAEYVRHRLLTTQLPAGHDG